MIDQKTRFINFIVDTMVYFLLIIIISFLLGEWALDYRVRFILISLYFWYYLIMEATLGQTVGKFITKTKVVNKDLSKPSFIRVLLRTVSRFIPIDVFSYLFGEQGIHDSISRTQLIKN